MRISVATRAAAAAAFIAVSPAQAQTVLTVSSWVPASVPLSLVQKEWCDLLEKNTGSKMRCNHLPRAVANPPGTYDAIKSGLADISFAVPGYTPGRFVLPQIAEFPFLGDSAEAISAAFSRVAARYPQFSKEMDEVHVLAYFTDAPGMLLNTKRPVTKLEDLQGLKWRITGGIVGEMSQALGMNGTLKPATDTYELLSSGIMDGTLFPADAIEPWKLEKLIKHATVIPGGLYNTGFVFIMNKARYDKLAPEEKKAIDAISGEVAARMFGRGWDKADRRGYALMQANDVKIVKADPKFVADIKARVAPVENAWVERAKAKGLPDPAKVLQEFRTEITKAAK
ncbi:TRAP transporter substrate-binding protein [Ramlibacter sp. AN1015]|uniref:TRAP transporter substrate-binding protein n=1 Tax=Ramlibacter sp. AN1015 TaxID=3133428 RepID=UPI0030C260C3